MFHSYLALPKLPPLPPLPAARGPANVQLLRRRPADAFLPALGTPPRLVVIANTQAPGFAPASFLRPGDYCIHLNRARHAPACMAVPGTRHALLCRRNTDAAGWFTPAAGFNGFDRVLFVDFGELCIGSSWYAEWSRLTSASPTSGFIAANLCRELHPQLPLLLLGFDPAHERGSYRWAGHEWEREAAWYEQRGFNLLPPGAPPVCHQIWLGPPPKPEMTRWMEGIRSGATAAGWRYALWDWPALRQRFAADPVTPLLDKLLDVAPSPATYGVISDYYKHALMAAPYGAGSLYLDTDIYLTGPWPAMPTDADVYVMTEQFRTDLRANGAFWLPPLRSEAPFTLTCALMRQRLASLFSAPERLTADTVRRLYASTRVPYIIGPYFLRVHAYPAWDADGVRSSIFSKDLLSHLSWRRPSSFTHVGTATWKQSASDNE